MEAAGHKVATIARRVARSMTPKSTLVRDTVELSTSRTTVQAGAAVIRTASELLGTIVDLFA